MTRHHCKRHPLGPAPRECLVCWAALYDETARARWFPGGDGPARPDGPTPDFPVRGGPAAAPPEAEESVARYGGRECHAGGAGREWVIEVRTTRVRGAPGRAGAPPCDHLGDPLTGRERQSLGLDHRLDWRRCGLGLSVGGSPPGVVCRCRGCGPACPSYAPSPAPD